jgi:hypothetical protein
MVPLNAARAFPEQHYMRKHGIQAIVNQTVRTLLHSTLRYHIKNLKVKYPDVDIILIQPEWNDERMFSHNPMYFSSRLLLAEHGFSTVTNGLIENFDYYQQVLARHDIELHTDVVRQELDALRQQPGSEQFLRHMLTEPFIKRNGASLLDGQEDAPEDAEAASLQTSLNRLEHNLDRLDQLIGDSD